MLRRLPAAALLLAVSAASLGAHDLFLRPRSFFVPARTTVAVRVLNGTFDRSEGSVAPDRLLDVSLAGARGRETLPASAWMEGTTTSAVRLRTNGPGTYTLGASLKPRSISLTAEQFNEYLRTDGLPDVLAERERAGELEKPATERYAKHVKAVLQVGATRDEGHATVFGYPAELVPLENPYRLRRGDTLRVRALVDGRPVANQLVIAGGRLPNGRRMPVQQLRTDADGVARVRLGAKGDVYVKFISMAPMGGREGFDYESKWATLTFGVR